MCKLCNTNSPPVVSKSVIYADKLEVVKQYIGTYPCIKCTHQIMTWSRATNDLTQIDQYILFKLFRVYALANFTKEQLAKRKSYNTVAAHHKQAALPGIRQIITKSTGNVKYLVRHRFNKEQQVTIGTYQTLSEALQVKVNYMQQNGCKQGLTQLSNKLKELTNGTI